MTSDLLPNSVVVNNETVYTHLRRYLPIEDHPPAEMSQLAAAAKSFRFGEPINAGAMHTIPVKALLHTLADTDDLAQLYQNATRLVVEMVYSDAFRRERVAHYAAMAGVPPFSVVLQVIGAVVRWALAVHYCAGNDAALTEAFLEHPDHSVVLAKTARWAFDAFFPAEAKTSLDKLPLVLKVCPYVFSPDAEAERRQARAGQDGAPDEPDQTLVALAGLIQRTWTAVSAHPATDWTCTEVARRLLAAGVEYPTSLSEDDPEA